MPVDALHLRTMLESALACRVFLVLTHNKSRVLSWQTLPGGQGRTVRVHHLVLQAPDEVLSDVCLWVRGRKPTPHLDQWISRTLHAAEVASRVHKPPRLRTRGMTWDLQEELIAVCRRLGIPQEGFTIGWAAQRKRTSACRRFNLGTYDDLTRTIRVHRVLDQPHVPRHVLHYIIFHELLHYLVPPRSGRTGRRRIHDHEFSHLERLFPETNTALDWLRSEAGFRM